MLKSFVLFSFLLLFFKYVSVFCEYEHLIHSQKLPEFSCRDVCKDIVCERIRNCVDGIIVSNGSYCSCCDLCVKFLDKGDICEEVIEGSLRKTTINRCRPGLKCENGKCKKDEFESTYDCLKQKDLRKRKKGIGYYSNDLWVPECKENGHYKANQLKNRKSICVDEDGNKLFGNADDSLENACACSRRMQKIQKESYILYNIKPQEHCTSYGSFKSLQCIGNLCYCADEETGEARSHLVRLDNLDKLPATCYNLDEPESSYLTNCEVELQRSKQLIYEFHLKEVELVGIIKVRCDPDGTFGSTQCQPDRCVCTNIEGIGIGSYAITNDDLENLNIVMTCNCARDEAHTPAAFKCKGYGNYALLQCFNSEKCHCVDEDGDIISIQLPKASTNESYCENLLQGLFNPLEKETTLTESTLAESTLTESKVSETDDDY